MYDEDFLLDYRHTCRSCGLMYDNSQKTCMVCKERDFAVEYVGGCGYEDEYPENL